MQTLEEALYAAGWTLWTGGPCPVPEDSYPIVLFAGGDTDCERASDFEWEWSNEYLHDNIIAYKEIE